jgi:hypothetical protein
MVGLFECGTLIGTYLSVAEAMVAAEREFYAVIRVKRQPILASGYTIEEV